MTESYHHKFVIILLSSLVLTILKLS